MNDLQRLLKLRGKTCRDIATVTGLDYYSVQKTVSQASYRSLSGKIRIRQPRHIRQKVADALGLRYEQVWGNQSTLVLKRLIRAEIKRLASTAALAKEAELLAANLPDDCKLSDERAARNG